MNGRVAALAFLPAAVAVQAMDFGSPAEVKAVHPEFFAPAHVSVVTNCGTALYVYNGRARRLFQNMPPMALPQLREAAQLRAENNLSKFLVKGRPRRTITLRGSRQIAKEINGRWITYVFAVPVEGVEIVDQPSKAVSQVTESQTNKTSAAMVALKTSGDGETKLFALLDLVENNPHDNSARAKLAKVMFEQHLYEESVEQCIRVQNTLIPLMCADVPNKTIELLLSVSEILKECGEYRRAREGYRAVQRLERNEYRRSVLQALSQLQLKLGVE